VERGCKKILSLNEGQLLQHIPELGDITLLGAAATSIPSLPETRLLADAVTLPLNIFVDILSNARDQRGEWQFRKENFVPSRPFVRRKCW
jgi:hypothetical protein